MTVLERFLNYAKIHTTSDPTSDTFPSSMRQFDLAKFLVKELKELGLEAEVDEHCYVYSKIPANTDRDISPIGFIAHMDTSPDASGENVKPRIIEDYDGNDILLNKDDNLILSPNDFPSLSKYIGQTLVVTDGTTLLGADDKAGIAEIMTAAEHLINHPEIEHGDIMIAFTPDEEIGQGAKYFDVKKFGASFAYTIDGGECGELEYESFNANNAKISFYGRNVHPGSAKNQMINSIEMAMEFQSLLPENEKPQYTSGYEGFYHLMSFKGSVDKTVLEYIIRDHDRDLFEKKKQTFKETAKFIEKRYGKGSVKVEAKDSYYNMGEVIKEHMHLITRAKVAMNKNDVKEIIKPVRGGTDGSALSFMGLPCPNIFTGGHNYHGRHEYVCVESMEKAVAVIISLIHSFTKTEH